MARSTCIRSSHTLHFSLSILCCCCCGRSAQVLKIGAYDSTECSFFFVLLSRLLRHLGHTRHHHARHHHGETTHRRLLAGLLSSSGLLLSLHHVHLHKSLMVLGQSLLLHHDNLLIVLGHLLRGIWDLCAGGLTLRHLHHLGREHRHIGHLTLSTSCGHARHHHGESSHLRHLTCLSLCCSRRINSFSLNFFLSNCGGSIFLVLVLFVLLLGFGNGRFGFF